MFPHPSNNLEGANIELAAASLEKGIEDSVRIDFKSIARPGLLEWTQ